MKPHGPWKIKSSSTPYQDPFINVQLDQVIRPDGKDGQHVVVHVKAGVCVIAVDDDCNVYLTNEFHYGIGKYSLEGISGGIETNETPLASAKRELQEEVGLAATTWDFLTAVDPFTTIVVSPTRLYLATGLSDVPKSPEGTEQIATVKLSLVDAIERVKKGTISHAPTCVGLLLAAQKIERSSL